MRLIKTADTNTMQNRQPTTELLVRVRVGRQTFGNRSQLATGPSGKGACIQTAAVKAPHPGEYKTEIQSPQRARPVRATAKTHQTTLALAFNSQDQHCHVLRCTFPDCSAYSAEREGSGVLRTSEYRCLEIVSPFSYLVPRAQQAIRSDQ